MMDELNVLKSDIDIASVHESIEAIAKRTKDVQLLRKLVELSCSEFGSSRFKAILCECEFLITRPDWMSDFELKMQKTLPMNPSLEQTLQCFAQALKDSNQAAISYFYEKVSLEELQYYDRSFVKSDLYDQHLLARLLEKVIPVVEEDLDFIINSFNKAVSESQTKKKILLLSDSTDFHEKINLCDIVYIWSDSSFLYLEIPRTSLKKTMIRCLLSTFFKFSFGVFISIDSLGLRCANWVDFIQEFSVILPNIYDVISNSIIVEVRQENKDLLHEVESLVRNNSLFNRLNPSVFSCKKGMLNSTFKLRRLASQNFPLCAEVSAETMQYVESTIARLKFLYEDRRVKQFDELFQKLSRITDCINDDVISKKFFIAKDAFTTHRKSQTDIIDQVKPYLDNMSTENIIKLNDALLFARSVDDELVERLRCSIKEKCLSDMQDIYKHGYWLNLINSIGEHELADEISKLYFSHEESFLKSVNKFLAEKQFSKILENSSKLVYLFENSDNAKNFKRKMSIVLDNFLDQIFEADSDTILVEYLDILKIIDSSLLAKAKDKARLYIFGLIKAIDQDNFSYKDYTRVVALEKIHASLSLKYVSLVKETANKKLSEYLSGVSEYSEVLKEFWKAVAKGNSFEKEKVPYIFGQAEEVVSWCQYQVRLLKVSSETSCSVSEVFHEHYQAVIQDLVLPSTMNFVLLLNSASAYGKILTDLHKMVSSGIDLSRILELNKQLILKIVEREATALNLPEFFVKAKILFTFEVLKPALEAYRENLDKEYRSFRVKVSGLNIDSNREIKEAVNYLDVIRQYELIDEAFFQLDYSSLGQELLDKIEAYKSKIYASFANFSDLPQDKLIANLKNVSELGVILPSVLNNINSKLSTSFFDLTAVCRQKFAAIFTFEDLDQVGFKKIDVLFSSLSVFGIDLKEGFHIFKDSFYKKVQSLLPQVARYLSLNKFDKFKRCMNIMQTLELNDEHASYESKFVDQVHLLKREFSVSEAYDKIYNALFSLRTSYNEEYNELLSVVKARQPNAELNHIINVFSKEPCSVRDILAEMSDYELSRLINF